MKNFSAVLLIAFVCIVSVAVPFLALGHNITDLPSISSVPSNINFTPFDYYFTEVSSSSENAVVTSNNSSYVQVLGEEHAIGKIYTKTLSPYSAPVSYDNIYLKNSTGVNIDIKKELERSGGVKIKDISVPQVLIVHTHGSEAFMDAPRDYYTENDCFNTTDSTKSVIRLGDIVADILQKGGIGVIHDTTLHDSPQYSGSYLRAEKTITDILKKYPTIKVVLDIHRDSISQNSTDRIRPVANINGKEAAQVMLVMGSNTGNVSGFENWRENLSLALKYQQNLESMYPSLARSMTLASKKYNQHLTVGSMLIEIGTDVNTLEQAEYAAELSANALLKTLNEKR